MGLYLDSGYLDFDWIISRGMPFIFITGGRGTGKTYGALDYCLKNNKHFMFMRRTAKQTALIKKPQYSPFTPIERDSGTSLQIESLSEDMGAVYRAEDSGDGKKTVSGLPIGNICALSTVANIRGFDGSDIDILILDEFIKSAQEKSIKDEASAFANVYETINRNRELQGKKPLIAILLSNSNELANDYFMSFGFVNKLLEMRKNHKEVAILQTRGAMLIDLQKSPISEKKAETALYRLTGKESSISRMALNNEYCADDLSMIKSYNLSGFKPLVNIGEITIYQPKQNGYFYVSNKQDFTAPKYEAAGSSRQKFITLYRGLVTMYYRGNIRFEDYPCKALFEAVFDI